MAVILKVTETKLNRSECYVYEAPNKHVAIGAYLKDRNFSNYIGNSDTVEDLLSMHDDIRIGGPTWDTRFEFDFKI